MAALSLNHAPCASSLFLSTLVAKRNASQSSAVVRCVMKLVCPKTPRIVLSNLIPAHRSYRNLFVIYSSQNISHNDVGQAGPSPARSQSRIAPATARGSRITSAPSAIRTFTTCLTTHRTSSGSESAPSPTRGFRLQ